MSLDQTQRRHVALLNTLAAALQSQGWATTLIPPREYTPMYVLVCMRRLETRLPPALLSYIPLEDEAEGLELLQMTCDVPGFVQDDRLQEMMTLLHALNVTMPLGAFCVSTLETATVYLRHVYAHELTMPPHVPDVIRMVGMMTGMTGVFEPTIQAVMLGSPAAKALQQAGRPVPTIDTRPLLEQVTDYLERKNMSYDLAQDVAAIVLIQGKNGTFNLILQVREQERQVVAYSVGSLRTPPEQLTEMAFFVTRANYGLFIGNFEMDLNDGEVRYKVSQDLGTQPLTDEILGRLIQSSVRAYDPYVPGIKAVAEGRLSAQAAITQIEG